MALRLTDVSAGAGISGYSGVGRSGFSGYSGAAGAAAASGFSGYSGVSGWSGYSGAQGISGFSGYSGAQGVSGFSGYSGRSGFSGYSGVSGFSGYSGAAGVIGYDGASGFSGYSGRLATWIKITSNTTAVSGGQYLADTTGGSFTLTLPALPSLGDIVVIGDGGDWSVNNLTVSGNGNTIEGGVETTLICDIKNTVAFIIYDGSTWQVNPTAGPKGFSGYSGYSGVNTNSVGSTLYLYNNYGGF